MALTKSLFWLPWMVSFDLKKVNPMSNPPITFKLSFDTRYVGSRQKAKCCRLRSSRVWYVHEVANFVSTVAVTGGPFLPFSWISDIFVSRSWKTEEFNHTSRQSMSLTAVAPAPMTSSMYSALLVLLVTVLVLWINSQRTDFLWGHICEHLVVRNNWSCPVRFYQYPQRKPFARLSEAATVDRKPMEHQVKWKCKRCWREHTVNNSAEGWWILQSTVQIFVTRLDYDSWVLRAQNGLTVVCEASKEWHDRPGTLRIQARCRFVEKEEQLRL